MKFAIFVFAGILVFTILVDAKTIYVPDDYAKIQEAIDASFNGDTIIVRPGTYVENINFNGKATTVISEEGPYSTFIDGSQLDSVIRFENGESNSSVVEGFTVFNGWAKHGAGFLCYQASPIISSNIIFGNTTVGTPTNGGAGVYCKSSSAIVTNNIIFNNKAQQGQGGGISSYYGNNTIINNIIYGNKGSDGGGGIYCRGEPIIINNLIYNNSGSSWGVVFIVLISVLQKYIIILYTIILL